MMQRSETIGALASALSAAQARLAPVWKSKTAKIKTRQGGEYSYSYADLSAVWDSIREPLSANGLAIIQLPELQLTPDGENYIALTTTLMHSSGEHISSTIATVIDRDATPQVVGTAITYLRRYAICSMVGVVADDDDDAAAASQVRQKPAERATRPAERAQPPRLPSQPAEAAEELPAAERARRRFYQLWGQTLKPDGGTPTWPNVRQHLKLTANMPEPVTVKDWANTNELMEAALVKAVKAEAEQPEHLAEAPAL